MWADASKKRCLEGGRCYLALTLPLLRRPVGCPNFSTKMWPPVGLALIDLYFSIFKVELFLNISLTFDFTFSCLNVLSRQSPVSKAAVLLLILFRFSVQLLPTNDSGLYIQQIFKLVPLNMLSVT